MGVYRSTDPTVWDDVDGIIINESAPAPSISGVAANIAILCAQFERGLPALTDVGSIGSLQEAYGANDAFGGNIELKNKKFGRLRAIRVVASDAVLATKTFQGGASVDTIKFSAKQGKGAYGNGIEVTVEAGSDSGKKYTVEDTNSTATLPLEVYDNVVITAVDTSTFAASLLCDVEVLDDGQEPDNAAATALASGDDGTVADTDYETAIARAKVEAAGNILFLDSYNATRNGYLKTHAADTADKMVALADVEDATRANAVTNVAGFRDADGRLIYCYPWIQTSIGGSNVYTLPTSWMASIISQTSPHIDPAFAANTQFLAGVTGLRQDLDRDDYIALKDAGVAAFEFDSDIGFKVKSGVVTQIANSSKATILRRRMADWLTASAARFLKNYQNSVNSAERRKEVKGAFLDFVQRQEQNGILPKDSEVNTGLAKLVDTDSLNTDNSIALGFFKILWKQRIYSAMRFIVLQAEIGESVVVTEGE